MPKCERQRVSRPRPNRGLSEVFKAAWAARKATWMEGSRRLSEFSDHFQSATLCQGNAISLLTSDSARHHPCRPLSLGDLTVKSEFSYLVNGYDYPCDLYLPLEGRLGCELMSLCKLLIILRVCLGDEFVSCAPSSYNIIFSRLDALWGLLSIFSKKYV